MQIRAEEQDDEDKTQISLMGQHGPDPKEAANSDKIKMMTEVLGAAGELNQKTAVKESPRAVR